MVKCTVRQQPESTEYVEQDLPMYDPHEMLDYLWRTQRIQVSAKEIQRLALNINGSAPPASYGAESGCVLR